MKVTITDEQIRELLATIPREGGINAARRDACLVALGLPCPQPHPATGVAPLTRDAARTRCAEILAARKADDLLRVNDLLSQRRALVADLRSCGSDRLTRATIEAQIKMLDGQIAGVRR